MSNILSLDIGTKHTGCAFASAETGIALPLATFHHTSSTELFDHVKKLCAERSIEKIIIGLPKLPSGEEGEQASKVRLAAKQLEALSLPMVFVDERYTSQGTGSRLDKRSVITGPIDDNAVAATHILANFLGY